MLAAVGQICSTNNVTRNAALCVSLIRRAASARCALLFLPEASDFIADAKEVPKLSASLDESEFVREVRAQAKESAIWVGVGVHEKATEDKCYNTNLLISPDGEIAQAYRKLHLFDVKHSGPGGGIMMESNTTIQGNELLDPQETPIGKVGLLTCYDLRFPEAALSLRRRGAHVIAYPSAFTLTTGPAHWDALIAPDAFKGRMALQEACLREDLRTDNLYSPQRSSSAHARLRISATFSRQRRSANTRPRGRPTATR